MYNNKLHRTDTNFNSPLGVRGSFFLFFLIFFPASIISAEPFLNNIYNYIENTAVYEQNQVEGRSYYIPKTSVSLNGNWKFGFFNTPDELPKNCFQDGFNDKSWSLISVPSNWEMQGFGDKKFRNVNLPFKPNPPYVPREYNPTGCYRRTFEVPASWSGQEIFIRFEKVASASFVWINGKEVGYNEGAHEPSEYNITPFIKNGKNTVTVVVIKYSDGSYLEDQDNWRLAGIFDDVNVFAAPKTRIFDWTVETNLDKKYVNSELNVAVKLKNYDKSANKKVTVEASLLDVNNQVIKTIISSSELIAENSELTVNLATLIQHPQLWSAEHPNLYTLKLALKNDKGALCDQITTILGFKKTEIQGEVFLFNGKPLKISGTNSHMHHPLLGNRMDEATIRKDFEILKQFNFNAVRTCHYPPTNAYLRLANEYGIYIIDETGDEAHATEWISNKIEFAEMYKERVRSMVLRDRNNPCIIFWSAGNESGEGENITKVITEGKRLDKTRPWMYGGNAFSHPAEDIIGPRYPFPLEHEVQVGMKNNKADRRPSFLDEYLSNAGNGGGAMDEYWEEFYKYPRNMGGAMWDWVSIGVTEPVRRLKDTSENNILTHIMGNALLKKVDNRTVIDLNGQDQWVEVYEDPRTEITGNELTISMNLFPRQLENAANSFITKGNNQFGIQQKGKDKLAFFIYTNHKQELEIPLPTNWYNNWHQVVAKFENGAMILFVDSKELARKVLNGSISNLPFPINIGRNAETEGQEITGYLCNALIDNVGIFNKSVALDSLNNASDFLKKSATLWLDFDDEQRNGNFYSYGIGGRTYGSIWPDRTVQPEMWQFKHSTQPISCKLISANNKTVEIWNRNHFTNASEYKHTWTIEADGQILQKGTIALDIEPLSRKIVKIPFDKPSIKTGVEYRLLISSCTEKEEKWAKAGYEVAWSQLTLPWSKVEVEKETLVSKPTMNVDKKGNIVVSGVNFCYTFDKVSGILSSVKVKGIELFKQGLTMNVWRAPLANDLDDWNAQTAKSNNWLPGMGWRVAAEFFSTGIDRLTQLPVSVDTVSVDGKVLVNVEDIWLTGNNNVIEKKDLYIEGRPSNGFKNYYQYSIDGNGIITLKHQLSTSGKMPLYLPRIGLQMVFDRSVEQVAWYGRGPQENYPDRKTGYKIGIYKTTVTDMFEPYLIPQDCGLRTDNRWVKMTNKDGVGIEFKSDKLFNFNAYHYSTDNLSRAKYPYQLQAFDGTTFNFDYETTGVGCTCRGVFNDYKVYPNKQERTVIFKPIF